ncbi:unnamed protein product [Moneuplotes crassus]|uniref:Uncharacterized protein n=1 Tax=Euplotes crassus TaxID=5936 RepID=A0AAD1UPI7_EUPCR|nr:unnamed protein product [Moneuplotes crassus]
MKFIYGSYNNLSLFLERYSDLSFVKKDGILVVPPCDNIFISLFPEKNHNVSKFLANSIANSVCNLELFLRNKLWPINNYFPEFMRISSKVLQSVCFGDFRINQKQLQRIISAFRHVGNISIFRCAISVQKVPNFKYALKNCKIKTFVLSNTGRSILKSLFQTPEEFINLVEGLSTSPDFNQSLETFKILSLPYNESCIRNILNTYNFKTAIIKKSWF